MKLIWSFVLAVTLSASAQIPPNVMNWMRIAAHPSPSGGIPNPLTNNLGGYWKLDENAGTTTADSFGTNTGTLSASALWNTGQIGSAIKVVPNQNVSVGSSASIQPTNIGTINCWFYTTNLSSSQNKAIISDSNFNTDRNGYTLYIGSGNQLKIELANASAAAVAGGFGAALTVTNWWMLSATWDATTVKLYTNGVFNTSASQNQNATSGTYPTRFGTDGNSGNGNSMTIDEVAIWTRALSASEINQIYTNNIVGVRPFP
jgi:hypothetical protein